MQDGGLHPPYGRLAGPLHSNDAKQCYLRLNQARIRKGSGPEIMAALRNAAIGFLPITRATNIAEALRRNAFRVQTHFAGLGIFNLLMRLAIAQEGVACSGRPLDSRSNGLE